MTNSKNDLRLARVALLETRMAVQLSALIRSYNGIPICVASVSEQPVDSSGDVDRLIDNLSYNVVPIPAALPLLATGLIALGAVRYRRRLRQ